MPGYNLTGIKAPDGCSSIVHTVIIGILEILEIINQTVRHGYSVDFEHYGHFMNFRKGHASGQVQPICRIECAGNQYQQAALRFQEGGIDVSRTDRRTCIECDQPMDAATRYCPRCGTEQWGRRKP